MARKGVHILDEDRDAADQAGIERIAAIYLAACGETEGAALAKAS